MITMDAVPYILAILIPLFFVLGYLLGKTREKKKEAALFDLLIDRQNYTTEVLSEYYIDLLEGKAVSDAEDWVVERIETWDSLHALAKRAG